MTWIILGGIAAFLLFVLPAIVIAFSSGWVGDCIIWVVEKPLFWYDAYLGFLHKLFNKV